MRVVVTGGTGHIGSFLVPRLVRAGHEVTVISRGAAAPYTGTPEWEQVRMVKADREQEDARGTFARTVLDSRPEAVIDLVCFTEDSARSLVEGLRGEIAHLVHCGSIWRCGPSRTLPITEEHAERDAEPPTDEYGIQKAAIARLLAAETAGGGLVTTSLHPGHIVGPGWEPIGPLGSLDPGVWRTIAAGEVLRIPGTGTEMMHHVHADDVAQAFEKALAHREAAAGQDMNIVAPNAFSVRGYAQVAAGWFGQDQARLETVGWEAFRAGTTEEFADHSWGHLHRSQVFSIRKAEELIDFRPAWRVEDAVLESLHRLQDEGRLDAGRELVA